MLEFGNVLNGVIPAFLIVGAGFLLRRLRWLTAEADQSLVRLTINLLMPCLVVDAALGNPALAQWRNLVLAPLVGAGTFVLGMLFATPFQTVAGLRTPAERRTFSLTVGLYNYGFIPIPLAMLLFSKETVGVLFVHNLGVEFALWTIGLMVITGARASGGIKQLINAPLVAMVLALTLNFSGAAGHLPRSVVTALHILGQCAIPLSLILAGAVIDDHLEELHSTMSWRVITVSAVLRLVLLPVCFLVLAKYLPASDELKRVIVLEAAMPSAVFPIVMSKHYNGDPPTALRVVVGTSVISLITIPFWIRFGLSWLGL